MSSILKIKDETGHEEINVDYKKIQKMAFIYKGLEDGYTIKKINDNKYEFTKEGKIEFKNFVEKHLNTKNIIKHDKV